MTALALLHPTEELTSVTAEIECLFRLLARYDSGFGNNEYRASGRCRFDGWRHPVIEQHLKNKGYADRHDLTAHDLRGLHWNLTKLLGRYEQNACIRFCPWPLAQS